jgi:hypothetical protein
MLLMVWCCCSSWSAHPFAGGSGYTPVRRRTALKHLQRSEVYQIPDFYAGRHRPRGESRACESLAYL